MGSVSFHCRTETVGVAQGYIYIASDRASGSLLNYEEPGFLIFGFRHGLWEQRNGNGRQGILNVMTGSPKVRMLLVVLPRTRARHVSLE